MKTRILSLGLVLVSSMAQAAPNVILITLDGVRYHEIFEGVRKSAGEPRGTPILPDVRTIIERDGVFIGNRPAGEPTMWVSNNSAISQPGYFALLSGQRERRCRDNDCPNIDRETIIDRLLDEGFRSKEVAVFASWNVIGQSIESKPGRAVRSISFESISGLSPAEAAPYEAVQTLARTDRPRWGGSRRDHYTYEMGLRYLSEFRPRFLYLSFVEPDEYGHLGEYPGYVRSLREFNDRFVQLIARLKTMGRYGEETSIVVTTDHGRGRGFLWKKHSKEWIDSRRMWAIVLPSEALRAAHAWERHPRPSYRQVDVRPTVELLLGLTPRPPAAGRGAPLIRAKK